LRFRSLASLPSFLELLEALEGAGEGAEAGGAASVLLFEILGATDDTLAPNAAVCFSRYDDIVIVTENTVSKAESSMWQVEIPWWQESGQL